LLGELGGDDIVQARRDRHAYVTGAGATRGPRGERHGAREPIDPPITSTRPAVPLWARGSRTGRWLARSRGVASRTRPIGSPGAGATRPMSATSTVPQKARPG